MMDTPVRPVPRMGLYEIPFWGFVNEKDLRLQRCSECGHFRFPPGPACSYCLSTEFTWEPVSGRGKVVSWVVFHRQYFPQIPVPYTVIAAELEEGPILIADLQSAGGTALRVGKAVEICYEPVLFEDGRDGMVYRWKIVDRG